MSFFQDFHMATGYGTSGFTPFQHQQEEQFELSPTESRLGFFDRLFKTTSDEQPVDVTQENDDKLFSFQMAEGYGTCSHDALQRFGKWAQGWVVSPLQLRHLRPVLSIISVLQFSLLVYPCAFGRHSNHHFTSFLALLVLKLIKSEKLRCLSYF